MKYIVVTMPDEKGDDQEAIFVFPRSLNHDFMMEGIQAFVAAGRKLAAQLGCRGDLRRLHQ